MIPRPIRILGVICVLAGVALLAGCDFRAQHSASASSKISFEPDIVYGHAGGVDLKLNLSRPAKFRDALACVLIFHGGAWRAGDRTQHDDLARQFAEHGYAAATVDYRLCPEFTFPAQIQDAKCAVRFLRANAAKYGIAPNRIGAIGFSAGAHLALLLGTMDDRDGFNDSGGWPGQPSKVQTVVSFFGPVDFNDKFFDADTGMLRDFFGGTRVQKPEAYATASPITHVDRGDAPMLLFHGTADPLVPWGQSVMMMDAMQKAGIPGRLEVIAGASHGFETAEMHRAIEASIAFFDQNLKVGQ